LVEASFVRSWVRFGSRAHLVAGPAATLTYCGRPVDRTSPIVVQRDEDTPPFACSDCLLAEPAPPAATPAELEYDPLEKRAVPRAAIPVRRERSE
jgi:hypothetical protein